LLAELRDKDAPLVRKLDPEAAKTKDIARISMDEAVFRKMHAEDQMASDKLQEGIDGFSKALVALEKLLGERLDALDGARASAAKELFTVFDLDGDGFITREEWGGSQAVFAALDLDGDGRITPDEMAAGLGAAQLLRQ
jgi:transaldolase